jgi:hypothetical protein
MNSFSGSMTFLGKQEDPAVGFPSFLSEKAPKSLKHFCSAWWAKSVPTLDDLSRTMIIYYIIASCVNICKPTTNIP